MIKNIILLIISFILMYFSKIYANEFNSLSNEIESNNNIIYVENDNFKVYIHQEYEDIPINSLEIFDKNNNKIVNKCWSSATILNNGNLLVGEYEKDGEYSYYEIDKNGNETFLIKFNYYIKNMHQETGNFFIIDLDDNNKYLGILDKDFKLIYEPIFEYNNQDFKNNLEILKVKQGKYGLFSIYGKTIIDPIFDELSYDDEKTINAIFEGNSYVLEKGKSSYVNKTSLNNVNNWAKKSIERAIDLGFISDSLQFKFNSNITREEFCELLIKVYENKTGFKVKINEEDNPFMDTQNEDVLKAYSLKIISGKYKNEFEPESFITREEAAFMLSNLVDIMGYINNEFSIVFEDRDQISDWAKVSTQRVSVLGLMIGDNNKNFNPKDNYTVYQAISTIMRLYDLK